MITKKPFGMLADGTAVSVYTMTSAANCTVKVLDLGVTVQSLLIPDRSGTPVDVVLGYDTAEAYMTNDGYLGAVVGRFANRIARGTFSLNGRNYDLYCNNGANHLHGGAQGFDRRIWDCEIRDDSLRFSRCSPDGEEGYPGNLCVSVTLRWSDDHTLELVYQAITDQDTVLNLTNHSYFNLAGTGDILDHRLQLRASSFTESDEELIPTGQILPTAGTAMDFLEPHPIGDHIDSDCPHLLRAGGYDHNYVLSGSPAAELHSPVSGITMTVETDQPGLQLYTANFLTRRTGKNGAVYSPRSGLCLETQHYPDSVHQPHWPSCILRRGETFQSRTAFSFGLKSNDT